MDMIFSWKNFFSVFFKNENVALKLSEISPLVISLKLLGSGTAWWSALLLVILEICSVNTRNTKKWIKYIYSIGPDKQLQIKNFTVYIKSIFKIKTRGQHSSLFYIVKGGDLRDSLVTPELISLIPLVGPLSRTP